MVDKPSISWVYGGVHIDGRRDLEVLGQCCGPEAEPDKAELDKQLELLVMVDVGPDTLEFPK